MEDTTIKVTLELELAADSLSGRAIDATGGERRFSGWIGLVGVIDQLLGRGPSAGVEGASIKEEERARN